MRETGEMVCTSFTSKVCVLWILLVQMLASMLWLQLWKVLLLNKKFEMGFKSDLLG